ncbi:hypothetical protein ACZ87_01689 [Candidatus Erwinia dacicola]|uniref:Uncharacterized protein n=1 Tax=Candidatus Erwinia dacicola TaxID=252393 RepID=A0A328TMA1_9GAMM|nr:hypothetical protein ACZ87_01689 [Candidatus Erwinia dacicola]
MAGVDGKLGDGAPPDAYSTWSRTRQLRPAAVLVRAGRHQTLARLVIVCQLL